jgi:hypothetical protein
MYINMYIYILYILYIYNFIYLIYLHITRYIHIFYTLWLFNIAMKNRPFMNDLAVYIYHDSSELVIFHDAK